MSPGHVPQYLAVRACGEGSVALSASWFATSGGIRVRRVGAVGRRPVIELSAIEEVVEAARDAISGDGLEGEPGIGKSRLLIPLPDGTRTN